MGPPREELEEIVGQVTEFAQAVPITHAVMNNNYEDDEGQRNAKTLARLAAQATTKPPG